MVNRMPGARAITALLWAIVLGVVGWAIGRHWALPSQPARQVDERVTLSVLQSQELAFLVTRRTVTQIVIEHAESDLWGEWRGVLWANVAWTWGVDMTKVTAQDLSRDGDSLVVRLPEPELLAFAIEPGSLGFLSKSTALPKLIDFSRGGWQRSILEGQVHERAMEFAQANGLLPTRQEIAAQLNHSAALLEAAVGTKIRFE